MDALTAQLVDLGMTGLLIAYLIRQNVTASKKNEELQGKYESLLREVINTVNGFKGD